MLINYLAFFIGGLSLKDSNPPHKSVSVVPHQGRCPKEYQLVVQGHTKYVYFLNTSNGKFFTSRDIIVHFCPLSPPPKTCDVSLKSVRPKLSTESLYTSTSSGFILLRGDIYRSTFNWLNTPYQTCKGAIWLCRSLLRQNGWSSFSWPEMVRFPYLLYKNTYCNFTILKVLMRLLYTSVS